MSHSSQSAQARPAGPFRFLLAFVFASVFLLVPLISKAQQPAPAPRATPTFCPYAKVFNEHGLRGEVQVFKRPAEAQDDHKGLVFNGDPVYVCEHVQDWYHIYFALGKKLPCTAGTNHGLPMDRTDDCRNAWIRQQWIRIPR